MSQEEKRRSDRVIPAISEEEAVLVGVGEGKPALAKLIDFSEVGTLVYLLVKMDSDLPIGEICTLTMYDQGSIFVVPSRIVRKNGHLIGFEFTHLSTATLHNVQSKLIRMEVEWLRLSKPTS